MNCQILLEDLTREKVAKSSLSGAILYDFITNIIELRIAVALYGSRTGYAITGVQVESEEVKVDVVPKLKY